MDAEDVFFRIKCLRSLSGDLLRQLLQQQHTNEDDFSKLCDLILADDQFIEHSIVCASVKVFEQFSRISKDQVAALMQDQKLIAGFGSCKSWKQLWQRFHDALLNCSNFILGRDATDNEQHQDFLMFSRMILRLEFAKLHHVFDKVELLTDTCNDSEKLVNKQQYERSEDDMLHTSNQCEESINHTEDYEKSNQMQQNNKCE